MINPIITNISCGDYNTYHHPNKEAMELYKKYTTEGLKQIHITHKKGNLCGYIDKEGNFGVIPKRFKNRMPLGDRKIILKAHKEVNGGWIEIKSGEFFLERSCIYMFVYISDAIFSGETKDKIVSLFGLIKKPAYTVFSNIEKNEVDGRFLKAEVIKQYKDIYTNMPEDEKSGGD